MACIAPEANTPRSAVAAGPDEDPQVPLEEQLERVHTPGSTPRGEEQGARCRLRMLRKQVANLLRGVLAAFWPFRRRSWPAALG